jgi:uncharacterized protein (DUF302 family)/ribosome-associated translation inhibitor RaiA
MQTPVQVTFRGLDHSDALDAAIRERMNWLEQFYKNIVSGKVLVEMPHRHRQHGRAFHVRVTLSVPGRPPIVVSHEPAPAPIRATNGDDERPALEATDSGERDALTAVHRAFDAAQRQLKEFARIERHDVKPHTRSGSDGFAGIPAEPPPSIVETAFGLRVEVPSTYEQTVEQVTAALEAQEFTVLTSIDVQQTMREALERDIRKYRLVGVCHWPLGHRALHSDLESGLRLACNVIVYESDPGWSVVSAVAPLAALGSDEHTDLREVGEEIEIRLRAALSALVAELVPGD